MLYADSGGPCLQENSVTSITQALLTMYHHKFNYPTSISTSTNYMEQLNSLFLKLEKHGYFFSIFFSIVHSALMFGLTAEGKKSGQ